MAGDHNHPVDPPPWANFVTVLVDGQYRAMEEQEARNRGLYPPREIVWHHVRWDGGFLGGIAERCLDMDTCTAGHIPIHFMRSGQ